MVDTVDDDQTSVWSWSSPGLQKFWNPNRSARDVIDIIGTCVRQSQIVTKTNDSSFSSKVYQKLIIFLILCSLWIGSKCIWVGKKAKTCLSKFVIKFIVFVFLLIMNLLSFHASSRLILHAEVSYIIDIACHWSFFFSIITSFSYFLDRQNPDFFPFSNSQFFVNRTHSTLITGLKHAISPYFGIGWVLFYNI